MIPTKEDNDFGGRLTFGFVCFIALIVGLAASAAIAAIGAVVSRILWTGLLVRLYELIFGYFGSYGSGWVKVSMAELHPQVHFWAPKIVSILGAVGALMFVMTQFFSGKNLGGIFDVSESCHPVAKLGLFFVLLPLFPFILAVAISALFIGGAYLMGRSFLNQRPWVTD